MFAFHPTLDQGSPVPIPQSNAGEEDQAGWGEARGVNGCHEVIG